MSLSQCPVSGEVIVRVAAVGLNFADTLMTRGKYQFKPELPFSPGAEIAGRIETIGPGVSGWADRAAGHGLRQLGRRAREDQRAG